MAPSTESQSYLPMPAYAGLIIIVVFAIYLDRDALGDPLVEVNVLPAVVGVRRNNLGRSCTVVRCTPGIGLVDAGPPAYLSLFEAPFCCACIAAATSLLGE